MDLAHRHDLGASAAAGSLLQPHAWPTRHPLTGVLQVAMLKRSATAPSQGARAAAEDELEDALASPKRSGKVQALPALLSLVPCRTLPRLFMPRLLCA